MEKREPLDDDEELAAREEFYAALPEAETSLTDEERADIKAARAEYRRGDLIVDPHTAPT